MVRVCVRGGCVRVRVYKVDKVCDRYSSWNSNHEYEMIYSGISLGKIQSSEVQWLLHIPPA
jgi:hypothetical protein